MITQYLDYFTLSTNYFWS